MSERVMRLEIDHARAFVMHKGRLPRDAAELCEWLDQFAEWEKLLATNIEKAFREHMEVCNRPIIIQNIHQEPRP